MEKVNFTSLIVEITRRCNLKCKHCFRGDAQDIDLSYESIDNLIKHTKSFGGLTITGGEPLMAFDKIKYLIENAIDNRVVITKFSLTTNGTYFNADMIPTFKKLFDWIKYVNETADKKDYSNEYIKSFIEVCVSADKYHDTDYDSLYDFINDSLCDYANVQLYAGGNAVVRHGRAKALSYAFENPKIRPHKIQIYGNGNLCLCKNVTKEMLDNQPPVNVITCPMMITAIGRLEQFYEVEFEEEDKNEYALVDFSNDGEIDIIAAIKKHNDISDFCNAIYDYREKNNINKNYLIYQNEVFNNKKMSNNDDRYTTSYEKLSDDNKFLKYSGATYQDRLIEALQKNKPRSRHEVLASEWFPDDTDKQKIKIIYTSLSKPDCSSFLELPEFEKQNLRLKDALFKVNAEINDRIQKNQNNHKMLITLYDMYKSGNYTIKQLFDIYQSNLNYMENIILGDQRIDIATFEKGLKENGEKNDYSESQKWNIIKLYFFEKLQQMILDIGFDKCKFTPDDIVDVEKVKSIITKRIAYIHTYDRLTDKYSDYYKADKFNKIQFLKMFDSTKSILLKYYETLLKCTIMQKCFVNNLDDVFKREHTYPGVTIDQADIVEKVNISYINEVIMQVKGGVENDV